MPDTLVGSTADMTHNIYQKLTDCGHLISFCSAVAFLVKDGHTIYCPTCDPEASAANYDAHQIYSCMSVENLDVPGTVVPLLVCEACHSLAGHNHEEHEALETAALLQDAEKMLARLRSIPQADPAIIAQLESEVQDLRRIMNAKNN
jgi:hypothetical protein